MISRKEYCYMYLVWVITICVLIWYFHTLLTLSEDGFEVNLDRKQGDL
jgi:hypothetical protein